MNEIIREPKMNFAFKLSLKIFLTGVTILAIVMIAVYYTSSKSILTSEMKHAQLVVDELSVSIDQNIIEKVKTTKAIAIAPVLTKALDESNAHFNSLSAQSRSEEIQSLNSRWKTTKDPKDSFILKYTDNQASRFLKNLQANLKGEYGEIFLTNRYGALVASTAKLTTLSHANKYWWKGAYNNGIGAVFFDDRGYDDSVGGYVLGVVIPIKDDDEIIGILKVNLNILGALSDLILYTKNKETLKYYEENTGVVKLIRSGGLIVFEEGVEPLSERIPVELEKRLKTENTSSFIYEKEGEDIITVMSEIGFTSNIEGFQFGGSFESSDHKQGNQGESWFVVNFLPVSNVVDPISFILGRLLVLGLLLSISITIIALIIGIRTAKPLKKLIRQTEQIAKGDFDSRVSTNRKDEIGLLATSFNKMAIGLNDSTTSIDKLNAEIHERKQVEIELRESEERFKRFFNDLGDAVFVTRVGGTDSAQILEVNPAAETQTGYNRDDLLKMNIARDLSIAGSSENHLDVWDEGLVKGKKVISVEKKRKKDGTEYWTQVVLTPIDYKGGKACLSINHDITKRKEAENALKESKAQLIELNASKDKFFSIIAHDLKSPFNNILGFSEVLIENIQKKDYEGIAKYAEIIKSSSRQSMDLLFNLMEWSQSQTGKMEYKPAKVEVVELINEITELLSFSTLQKSINISKELPDNIQVSGDKDMISTIMRNLISNAIKFTHPGGAIIISAEQKQNELMICVSDNGLGIKKESIDKLFRIEESTSTLGTNKEKGTGLGLILCKEFIEKHAGKIWVESKEGKGSNFKFTLPLNKL